MFLRRQTPASRGWKGRKQEVAICQRNSCKLPLNFPKWRLPAQISRNVFDRLKFRKGNICSPCPSPCSTPRPLTISACMQRFNQVVRPCSHAAAVVKSSKSTRHLSSLRQAHRLACLPSKTSRCHLSSSFCARNPHSFSLTSYSSLIHVAVCRQAQREGFTCLHWILTYENLLQSRPHISDGVWMLHRVPTKILLQRHTVSTCLNHPVVSFCVNTIQYYFITIADRPLRR